MILLFTTETEGTEMIEQEKTERILAACVEVHRCTGPGLSESAYEQCSCHELSFRDIPFRRQIDQPVVYKEVQLDCGYRIDLLVRDEIVIELKAVERLLPIHEARLLTYMKPAGKRVGLLISFNVPMLNDGIVRRVR